MVECSPATRAARVRFPDDANLFCRFIVNCKRESKVSGEEQKIAGDGGYRSPYLSHAKRALYHLSYVPSYSYGRSNKLGLADRQVAITPQLIRSVSAFCTNNFYHTFDSSVGRAVDCSCELSEIHRSLVQIRLEGLVLSKNKKR